MGWFWEGLGAFWAFWGPPKAFFSCFGTFLGCPAIFSMLLVNFWSFLLFLVTLGCCGMFLLSVACWAGFFAYCYCMGRAKRASEALWCLLWVSLAYPCFRWRTLAFCCVACSTMVCLLSLLSLALLCVTCFNSPKTISLLLLHASTTLICLRASRSLLRQVYWGLVANFSLIFRFCSSFFRFFDAS